MTASSSAAAAVSASSATATGEALGGVAADPATPSVAAIAGGTAGGAVALLALAAVVAALLARRRRASPGRMTSARRVAADADADASVKNPANIRLARASLWKGEWGWFQGSVDTKAGGGGAAGSGGGDGSNGGVKVMVNPASARGQRNAESNLSSLSRLNPLGSSQRNAGAEVDGGGSAGNGGGGSSGGIKVMVNPASARGQRSAESNASPPSGLNPLNNAGEAAAAAGAAAATAAAAAATAASPAAESRRTLALLQGHASTRRAAFSVQPASRIEVPAALP